ncbi:MAG: helix-hairpin-helix domain-containing protein [Phycisphaerales bacterium]
MTAPRCSDDRGFTLIAVLVIMGSALLVGTSLLFMAQAQAAGSAGAADAVQSRALAWSGIQAVMSTLNDQRQRILDGEVPAVADEYVVYETDTRLGVVRLLPVGPGGARSVPEAGKLDLNMVDAQMLAQTELIEPDLAEAVIEFRDRRLGRPFQSVAELLWVEGITPELLYGPIDDLTVMDEASGEPAQEAALNRSFDDVPRGLADIVTVYSFEPALQRNGRLRINLNTEWSEELGRRVEGRFGREVRDILRRIMVEEGRTFDSEAVLFDLLRFYSVAPDDWVEIVDTFTAESGELHFGRLDINTAPYEALVALPSLGPDEAAAIVQMRDGLSADDRATIVWPAIEGIVQPEAYDELAGRITTRCWTYRLRLAAGEVDPDDPSGSLTNPVIYEVVIDLSAPRPRVAYLRDITLLQTTAMLAANAASNAFDGPLDDEQPFADEVVTFDGGGSAAGELESLNDASEPAFDADLADADDMPPALDGVAGGRRGRRSSPTTSRSQSAASGRKRIGRWISGD